MSAQGLVRLVVVPGVNGQIEVVSLLGPKGPVEQVIARKLIGKGIQSAGADVALEVSHRVERGLAHIHIIIIGTLSVVCHGGEHVSVPVQHRAAGQLAVRIIKVAVKGRRGPAAAIEQILAHEYAHSRRQAQCQDQAHQRSSFNLLHAVPPLPGQRDRPPALPAAGPPP